MESLARPKTNGICAATLALSLGLVLALPVPPAAANPLNTELAGLLLDHPDIKAAQDGLESTRRDIDKQAAGFMPTVTATAQTGPEVIDSPARRGTGDGDPYSRNKMTANVTVTQNLFNGLATTSQVLSARLGTEASRLSLLATRQAALFEGVTSYIDVLRQKRLIELGRNNEANILAQLNLEDERVARGSGVTVDVLQAKSRLQIAKERRVNFEGALAAAVSGYKRVFGHAPNLDAMMDPAAPVELIPSELEAAVAIVIRENPQINKLASTVAVARERRHAARAAYAPEIDVVGAYNFERHNNTSIGVRRDYSVVLKASWDLFTGFSTRATIDQTNFDYRASNSNLDLVSRQIEDQTRSAWHTLLTARQRQELLENAVNIASEVFDSRRKLRAAGKETVINVLDAENEIYNAQINYTAASYDAILAVFRLLMAMGRLNAAYLDLG